MTSTSTQDQATARRRAREYAALGYTAIARTKGGWPKAGEAWHVAIQAEDRQFYHEYDVRVSEARDAYIRHTPAGKIA